MPGKLFAAALASAALIAAPVNAAPAPKNSAPNGASNVAALSKAIQGDGHSQGVDGCSQYGPGLLHTSCAAEQRARDDQTDNGDKGHCNPRGKGHEIGKGKGHDKDNDCPVSG
jgi:hypothetical protein